jgi:exopolyphosphatase/guanosine-5'-triphosphate,3'-diphosphate pyrophosphatase
MRFSAVDIGSNGVRILFAEVFKNSEGEDTFKKISLVRLPIRLGEDAFMHGKINEPRAEKLIKTLSAYKLLNEVYGVLDYRVCATSAMREASNSAELIDRIKNETGIQIEILKGKKEAEIIYENHVAESLNPRGCYLYVDVGGGSTEITLFKKGKRLKSESFDIGTLRVKNGIVKEETWESMRLWLSKYSEKFDPLLIIGTGGNINRLYKMAKLKDYAPFYYKQLKDLNGTLTKMSQNDMIEQLGLREDRADVIVPASDIFLKVMKWSNISEIMVPKLGLADGIIHELYATYQDRSKSIPSASM